MVSQGSLGKATTCLKEDMWRRGGVGCAPLSRVHFLFLSHPSAQETSQNAMTMLTGDATGTCWSASDTNNNTPPRLAGLTYRWGSVAPFGVGVCVSACTDGDPSKGRLAKQSVSQGSAGQRDESDDG